MLGTYPHINNRQLECKLSRVKERVMETFYVIVGVSIQEVPSSHDSLCIQHVLSPHTVSADSAETYPQHAQSLDGTMGSSIPLYRSSEEEKRVTVIKAPHYPGIGPVDESGIPTAIRTVGNARVCVAAGLGTDSTKDGLSMALCIPTLLYNEDCPLCHLSSHESYAVCGREREKELVDRSWSHTQSGFAF